VGSIEIRRVDTGDDREVHAFWEVGRDAVAERPYNSALSLPAVRAMMREPRSDFLHEWYAAWDGRRAVGTAYLLAPVADNTHLAWAEVHVVPDRRREGIGSDLIALVEERARAIGRTRVIVEAFAPVDGDSPALAFGRARGYIPMLDEAMMVLDVPGQTQRWAALADEIAPDHAAYHLETVVDRVPDHLVAGYCALTAAFNSLAPTGDMDVEDEVWDEARVRQRESAAAAAGRHLVVTLALDASERVVALTEIVHSEHSPDRAFQSGTLVLPDHRGHHLGLAVKLANQRELLARFPSVAWVVTGTADSNAAMRAVNGRLGYRVVERCVEVGKDL
jgi:GNAT superfamily N-acetyltransferase